MTAEIDRLLSKYNQDLAELDLPSYFTPTSTYVIPKTSPIVTKLKLSKINEELKMIRLAYANEPEVIESKILPIQSTLDEKVFVNDKLTELWIEKLSPPPTNNDSKSTGDDNDDNNETGKGDLRAKEATGTGANNDQETLSSLRKRLLQPSSHSVLDKSNDYHESIQEDILSELTGFASTLKDSALRLSSKIVEDTVVLEKTNENLLKNSNLMDVIDKNLNSYVLNKTGGKISFWFLMKVLLGIFVAFFLMVALIKIFPKF